MSDQPIRLIRAIGVVQQYFDENDPRNDPPAQEKEAATSK